jgi:ATP-binding cassette, subfamily B, bacterial PglK
LKSFREHPLYRVFEIVPGFLTKGNLLTIGLFLASQVVLSLLDLIGLALVGAVGSLSIGGLTNRSLNPAVEKVLTILQIENFEFKYQVILLSTLSCTFFITKTIGSFLVTRKMLRYLSDLTNSLTEKTIRKLFTKTLDGLPNRTLQEYLYAISSGIPNIIIGAISNILSIAADAMLIIILLAGLGVISPVSTALSLVILGGTGVLVLKKLSRMAAGLGSDNARLAIRSQETFQEVNRTFKENFVKGSLNYFTTEIINDRSKVSRIQAQITMFPSITKYIAEGSLVLGALLIALIEFRISSATHAISVIALFMAAGGRITPALLRAQQSYLTLKNSMGLSEMTILILRELEELAPFQHEPSKLPCSNHEFQSRVVVSQMSYTFQNTQGEVISNLSLTIEPGEFIAVTGESGSGKTTLIDILLGLRTPKSGSVKISGLDPISAISKWPGAIAYVPQEVFVSGKTLRENIGLGLPPNNVSDSLVWETLKQVQLDSWALELPEGLNTTLGDFGSKISGGQRQRIGIARALYTRPQLIILDEATSSLDSNTESKISELLRNLGTGVTVLVIAHRLSSIQHADRVVFLKAGKITGSGSFSELRESNSDFESLCKSFEVS